MNYQSKYLKYKTKYLRTQIGGNKTYQFILFGDVMTGDSVWLHDKEGNNINFVDQLHKLGEIIILKPNYVNFMKYSKKKEGNSLYSSSNKEIRFNKEDLEFENYANWVYDQIDKSKEYIAIGLEQGAHFAKFFCNQYPEKCKALYVLIDRNFTKKSYERTFHSESNYNFLKSVVGDNYRKYIIENLTNEIIQDLLDKIETNDSESNKKYIDLLNGLCKGLIRKQYSKIPKIKVPTYIFSDVGVATSEKLKDNDNFNKKSNNLITYFYVISDGYLIHSKYRDDIVYHIAGLIN